MAQLREILKRTGATIRDAILPPTCLSCDAAVKEQGSVCVRCWREIRFIEKPYCSVLGSPFAYDLGEEAQSAQAIAYPPVFNRARSAVLYDETARKLVQGLKFSDRTDLAPWMAQWMVRASRDFNLENTLVLPVPLHRRRLFARRFNQSAELARNIATLSQLTYAPELLIRFRATRQQVGLGVKERKKNVNGAFRVPKGMGIHIKGRSVLLIDDVYTTGATLDACARALKRSGAAEINCLTFARVANGVAVDDL